jgi:tRNA(Ile)-lysidine synthase
VSAAEDATPISAAEAATLFDDLRSAPALVIAVSGGPDSTTALLVLAARWRTGRKRGPALLAVTVDHGLRPDSAREARAV